jgi:hypothetical protein
VGEELAVAVECVPCRDAIVRDERPITMSYITEL